MSDQVTVGLWNRAVLRLSGTLLTGPDDNTAAAQQIATAWDGVRRSVLAAYPWNCAMRRATLAANAVPPEWGYAYAYTLPAACVRPWEVKGQTRSDWEVEGGQIVTDLPAPLRLRYIADIAVHEMDERLQALMVRELAAAVAYAITGNRDLATELEDKLPRMRQETRSADAMVGNTTEVYDGGGDDWAAVRA